MFIRSERLFLRPGWPEDWSAILQQVADEPRELVAQGVGLFHGSARLGEHGIGIGGEGAERADRVVQELARDVPDVVRAEPVVRRARERRHGYTRSRERGQESTVEREALQRGIVRNPPARRGIARRSTTPA